MVKPKKHVVKPANQDKATVSLIFGVVSFFTFLWWFLGIMFGLLGIVFGIVAIKEGQDKGRSIAGIALGASGIVLGLIVTLLIIFAVPKAAVNQQDDDRTTDANNLALQISNVVGYNRISKVSANDLSTDGFKIIKYVKDSGDPTQTLAVIGAGRFCDGTVGPNDYSVIVLMDDGSPYCTGYKQN